MPREARAPTVLYLPSRCPRTRAAALPWQRETGWGCQSEHPTTCPPACARLPLIHYLRAEVRRAVGDADPVGVGHKPPPPPRSPLVPDVREEGVAAAYGCHGSRRPGGGGSAEAPSQLGGGAWEPHPGEGEGRRKGASGRERR